MKKILITAFDAFGLDSINASFELLKALKDEIGSYKIDKLQIPTVRYKSFQKIKQALEHQTYDYVICLGQAANTDYIRLEKVAINYDDYRIQDNEGNQPKGELIDINADTAYFATLPLKTIAKTLEINHIPVQISYTAGTFVCNHVMYSVLNYCKDKPHMKCGFIHIPQIKNKNTIGLPLTTMTKALELLILNVDKNDVEMIGGNLD